MKDINATILVDLTLNEGELLASLHKDARWGIKKAIKEGLVVKESDEWDDFYDIYKETIKEGGGKIHSLNVIKDTSSNLFFCYYHNKIIAGITIGFREDKYNKNIPSLSKLASLKEYQHLQPNNLLVWHCIKWCKEKGYKQFELGGWQINARGHLIGINKFKEKWGKLVYYYKDYPFHVAIGRKLARNSGLFWWLSQRIKKIR